MTSKTMTSTKCVLISLLTAACVSGVSTAALAHAGDAGGADRLRLTTPRLGEAPAPSQLGARHLRLADVEVVTPPAPPQPVASAPAPAVVSEPVVVPPRREVVHHHEGSYMGTIAMNSLFGALAGGLVGGALYYLSDNQTHPQRIAYWAAGGVLVGAGVGVIQIMADNRVESVAMAKLPHDPAPTYRLSLLTARF